MNEFSREELLFGSAALERLKKCHGGGVWPWRRRFLYGGGTSPGRRRTFGAGGWRRGGADQYQPAADSHSPYGGKAQGRRYGGPYCRDQSSGKRGAAGLLLLEDTAGLLIFLLFPTWWTPWIQLPPAVACRALPGRRRAGYQLYGHRQ